MPSLILTGPRCSGKTVVGHILSEKLGVPLIDADHMFVEKHGDIASLVKKEGWEKFREYEANIIADICTTYKDRPIILTPGGGAVAHDQGKKYREQNVKNLQAFGKIIYLLPSENLEDSALVLTGRLQEDRQSALTRPALTKEDDEYKEMLHIIQKRHPLYLEAAHEVIYTGTKPAEKVADEIHKQFT